MLTQTCDIEFDIAGPEDDAAIRRLLRDGPMPGKIALSLQREPSFFAAAGIEGAEHQTVVARRDGAAVAIGSVSVRQRFFNGDAVRTGYLGSLRVHPSVAGRFDIIRRGYRFLHELCGQLQADVYFTSIAADNHRAIRLLERGVPGMPTYTHVGDVTTLLVQSRPCRRIVATPDISAVIELLGVVNPHYQFAPLWTVVEMDRLRAEYGLSNANFVTSESTGKVAACAALWDQRRFKQAVVTEYPWPVCTLRPVVNIVCRLMGRLGLPPIGRAISQAFVSHMACGPGECVALIDALAGKAHGAGIEMLAIDLDSRDPRLALLRRKFVTRSYQTRLYMVSWPDCPSQLPPPDGRLMYPEIALL